MLLAINTCLRSVEIALIDEAKSKIVAQFSEASDRDHIEKLFLFIGKTLKKKDKIIEPDKVLVVTGPGAFTSIRVGVVAANTIAFATGTNGRKHELYGIDLTVLFEQENKKLPIYLSGGKSEIYTLKSVNHFHKNDAAKFFDKIKTEFYGNLNDYHISMLKNPKLFKERAFSFGEAILKLLKSDKLKSYRIRPDEKGVVQTFPTYLKPPNISISKKEI